MGQAQTRMNMLKKSKRKFDPKEDYFNRNGGILLEKQITLSQGKNMGAQQLKIFSVLEIEKATNNYSPDLIVGRSTGVCVYKGTIDDRIVVIKAPQEVEENSSVINLFLTEASMGMVMCHSNMVKLHGCCLETYIPMLVCEFFPNQDLAKHLHGNAAFHKPLIWDDRLRVATDIAYVLSYIHNALSMPVVHRDVNPTAILLDSSFHAKLCGFGYSVSIIPGQIVKSMTVPGSPGYLDPEYIETKVVTERCDVYSFGVLLLELLTGKEPNKMAQCGTHLADAFVLAVGRNCMNEMIDSDVLVQGNTDEMQQVARLAMACVAPKGTERPTMIDIVNELRLIQTL